MLRRDLRFCLRQLARSPGFTGTAVLTLALGIGACVAIFSAVDGVLLRPLPYPQSDRLVAIHETLLPRFPEFAVSPRHYFGWRAQATGFQDLAAWHEGSHNLTGLGEPLRVSAGRVTASLLATLGVRPALGRAFSAAEDRPGGAKVAILGHGFWQRQLGGRPDVLQRTVTLDGQPFTIVGVMPPGFQLDRPLDLFTPAAYPPSDVHDIRVIGRLRPGVTLDQAHSELSLITRRLDDQPTEGASVWGTRVTPLLARQVQEVRPMLAALMGAVALLLFIACANVANLLLARATVRARELAVRAALGAGRRRIVRELLTESVLLAAAGALLGLLLAKLGLHALLALVPDRLPRAAEIAVDARAAGFAVALALATGIGFGLVPALRASRLDLSEVLKSGARGASEPAGHRRLRSALVVAEIAIALVLLAGGGLLIRSFVALQQVSPGFEPRGLLAVTLSLPQNQYAAGAQQAAFAARAVERLAAVPGVQSVGAAQGMPFESVTNHVFFFSVDGRPSPEPRPTASAFSVTGDFFGAMGIRLLRGRLFQASDFDPGPRVTVINESLARQHFPGIDPIGQRIAARPGEWFEIVGVVADVRFDRLDGGVALQAYAPFTRAPADWGDLTFVVRAVHSARLEDGLRAAIHTVDGGQAITRLRPASDWIAASLARQRFTMVLFAAFAAAALLLAAVGIYGLIAYTVTRRTAEIGIRVALGARPGNVLGLVFGQAGRLVALGLAAGLAGAFVLTRLLSALLFAVSPHDPLTFGAITLLVCLVAALACLVPARRAIRVDPMVALRAD